MYFCRDGAVAGTGKMTDTVEKGSGEWRPPSAQGKDSLIYSLSATGILPMRKNGTGCYPIPHHQS